MIIAVPDNIREFSPRAVYAYVMLAVHGGRVDDLESLAGICRRNRSTAGKALRELLAKHAVCAAWGKTQHGNKKHIFICDEVQPE